LFFFFFFLKISLSDENATILHINTPHPSQLANHVLRSLAGMLAEERCLMISIYLISKAAVCPRFSFPLWVIPFFFSFPERSDLLPLPVNNIQP
jgi:hypothetical protein